jgi:hypothetical protein
MSSNNIQPYILAVYSISNSGGTRQVLAVSSQGLHTSLRDEAVRLGGRRNGDWYAMATVSAVLSLVTTAKHMGGLAYNLPTI